MPQRTRSLSLAAALVVAGWLASALAFLTGPAARVARRTRRDEAGQEAITIAVAVLFGILLIAFTYPLWKGVVQAVVDKISKMVSDAT